MAQLTRKPLAQLEMTTFNALGKIETGESRCYLDQLISVNHKVDRKRPWTSKVRREMMLLHDNATPHIVLMTQRALITRLHGQLNTQT